MNLHEEAVVKGFVKRSRQQQLLCALANPKKRSRFTRELDRRGSRFLVHKYIRPVKGSDSLPISVCGILRKLGAPEVCWAVGGKFDGTEVELLKGVRDSGDGFLISCVPGKLAFVKTASEKLILFRR